MSAPKDLGQHWYERCKTHQGQALMLDPRDEIDLASFVLDRLVAEVDGKPGSGDKISQMLEVIGQATKSVKTVVREIDNFIGRMGTPAQRAYWKKARSAFA